ncbi:uncharacterized protein LOC110990645 [Acanthaster planci]|uniref:Uncharacterized protein LOC110990645 n=1 Tax=Acanthaster planci TaxID=133434 RepID=A0A8B8A392_ACAPL|nr:uncharacterized protein LOC110990645 [Acanthaster planci]
MPKIRVPVIEDRCIDEAEGPVNVTWDEVTAIDTAPENITCTESVGGTNVSLTGGVFGVGCYVVTCRIVLPDGKIVSANFSFYIIAIPIISVPEVEVQWIVCGKASILVTWDKVNATNADGNPINCTSDTGTNVTVTGGYFPVGSHTVTCSVTNGWGCFSSANFTFDVIESTTTPEPTTTPEKTTLEPTTTMDSTITSEPTSTLELTTKDSSTTREPTTTQEKTTLEPTTTMDSTRTPEPTSTLDLTTKDSSTTRGE